jgi:hypothetical protein
MATQFAFGKIVTDGLILALDAADKNSHVGSGTIWRDLSGNNSNATLNNFVGFATSPPTTTFDGGDDYAAIPYNSNFNSMIWTISCWIKLNSTPQSYDSIISRDYYDGVISFYIDCGLDTDNKFRAGSYKASPDTRYEISSTTTLSSRIGLWTNVLIYRTSDYKIGMFINGIKETETTFGSVDFGSTNSNSGITLGAINLVGVGLGIDRHTTVHISSVHIYNKALSTSEVLQNYNAQKSRFGL